MDLVDGLDTTRNIVLLDSRQEHLDRRMNKAILGVGFQIWRIDILPLAILAAQRGAIFPMCVSFDPGLISFSEESDCIDSVSLTQIRLRGWPAL